MHIVVCLEDSVENVVIPVKWLQKVDLVDTANNAVNQLKSAVVFYCNDSSRQPDFSLPIKRGFQPDEPSCYKARIVKFYGKNAILRMSSRKKKNLTSNIIKQILKTMLIRLL